MSGSMKISPLELMSAIFQGKSDLFDSSGAAIFGDNRQVLVIVTTSIVVLIGCVFLFIWRRSNGQKSIKAAEAPKPLILKEEAEPEVDDGKKKVTIFFGTQTGTAEGFAKVRV